MLLASLSVYVELQPPLLHCFLISSPPKLSRRAATKAQSCGVDSGSTSMIVCLIINAEAKCRTLYWLDYVYVEYHCTRRSTFRSVFKHSRLTGPPHSLKDNLLCSIGGLQWAAGLNSVAKIHLLSNSKSRSPICIWTSVANSAVHLISSQTPKTPHLWLQHFICYTVIHIFP